ncbi:unnamed protein product, partial [marine sediment metagenome]
GKYDESGVYFIPTLPNIREDPTGFEIVEHLKEIASNNMDRRKKGDKIVDIHDFWEKYASPPYGLNDNLLTLYILWTVWCEGFKLETIDNEYSFDFGSKPDVDSNRGFIDNLKNYEGSDFIIIQTTYLNPQTENWATKLNMQVLKNEEEIYLRSLH